MAFAFATCERPRALGFLRKLYPSTTVEDTADDAGPVLDLVERDVIRICDPDFHGGTVIASTNYATVPAGDIQSTLKRFNDAANARAKAT